MTFTRRPGIEGHRQVVEERATARSSARDAISCWEEARPHVSWWGALPRAAFDLDDLVVDAPFGSSKFEDSRPVACSFGRCRRSRWCSTDLSARSRVYRSSTSGAFRPETPERIEAAERCDGRAAPRRISRVPRADRPDEVAVTIGNVVDHRSNPRTDRPRCRRASSRSVAAPDHAFDTVVFVRRQAGGRSPTSRSTGASASAARSTAPAWATARRSTRPRSPTGSKRR